MSTKVKTPLYHKGIKFQIFPNEEQEDFITRIFDSYRFVYNHFLSELNEEFEADRGSLNTPNPLPKLDINPNVLIRKVNELKDTESLEWLNETPQNVLEYSVKDLIRAFTNYFKNPEVFKYPYFKKKNDIQSLNIDGLDVKLTGDQLLIKNFPGAIKVLISEQLPEYPLGSGRHHISRATIIKNTSEEYFISLVCLCISEPKSDKDAIQIKLGSRDSSIPPNLTKKEDIELYKKLEKRIRGLNKTIARREIGSKNYEEAMAQLARAHRRINALVNNK